MLLPPLLAVLRITMIPGRFTKPVGGLSDSSLVAKQVAVGEERCLGCSLLASSFSAHKEESSGGVEMPLLLYCMVQWYSAMPLSIATMGQ